MRKNIIFIALFLSFNAFGENCGPNFLDKKKLSLASPYMVIDIKCSSRFNPLFFISNKYFLLKRKLIEIERVENEEFKLKMNKLDSLYYAVDGVSLKRGRVSWRISNKRFLKSKKRVPANVGEFIYEETQAIDVRRGTFKGTHAFAHITASQGNFKQTSKNKDNLRTEQNSPLTFGVGVSHRLSTKWNLSYSGSLYYSHFNKSDIQIIDTTHTIATLRPKKEIGITSYLQKNRPDSFISGFYGGIDFESFSTFNLQEFADRESSELSLRKHSLGFMTLGMGLSFKLLLPSSLKLSYSKSFYSKGDLTGSKGILYFNQKISSRYWWHLFLKQHKLNDNHSLTINRVGLGLGMLLF